MENSLTIQIVVKTGIKFRGKTLLELNSNESTVYKPYVSLLLPLEWKAGAANSEFSGS